MELRQLYLLLVSLFLSNLAYAYIPPSQFIVKNSLSRHVHLKSLKVSSTITQIDSRSHTLMPMNRFSENFTYWADRRVSRSNAIDSEGRRLYSKDGSIKDLPLPILILIGARLPEVTSELIGAGIPILTDQSRPAVNTSALSTPPEGEATPSPIPEQTRLMKWKQSFVWVIGEVDKNVEKNPEKIYDHSSLWVEKDSFYPLRMIYPNQKNNRVEVQYEGFSSHRDFPYPRRMIYLDKDGLSWIVALKEFVVNTDAGPAIRDLEYEEGKFSGIGALSSPEIKQLIQQYYEVFR